MIYIAVFPVMIFILITVWLMELPEKARRRRYAEEYEKIMAKKRIEYEISQAREKDERIAEEKRKADEKLANERRIDDAIKQAIIKGVDVCSKCKTITPKRCSCGLCIKCTGKGDHSSECSQCQKKRNYRLYKEVKAIGLDACENCYKINPKRCGNNCGLCLECSDSTGDYCWSCNDAINGD